MDEVLSAFGTSAGPELDVAVQLGAVLRQLGPFISPSRTC